MCGYGCSSNADAGTKLAASAGELAFSVPDMSCGHCVRAIAEAFAEKLPGVPVAIDLPAKTVRVAAPAEVATAILAEAGYDAIRL